jgi:hypothetical protein
MGLKFRKLQRCPCATVSVRSNHCRKSNRIKWRHTSSLHKFNAYQLSRRNTSQIIFEPMIASKEPDHSLGGYSHQENWSCTRWKEKKKGKDFKTVCEKSWQR